MDANMKCLACKVRYARVRGCCDRCYNRCHKKVQEKLVTWKELEDRGEVLPATRMIFAKDYRLKRVPL